MSLKEKEKLRNALVEGNLLILQDFLHEDTDYVFTVKFEENSSCLHVACWFNQQEIIEELIDWEHPLELIDDAGATPLHYAVWKNNIPLALFLLNKGVDINSLDKSGKTILHLAVRNGYRPMISILITKGMNPNISDFEGLTPLHIAATEGHLTVIQDLVEEYDARINCITEEGLTPLHLASLNGFTNIVEKLLEYGSPIDITDMKGRSAYHHACSRFNDETVKLLIEKGCNIHLITTDGRSGPECVAERERRHEMLKLVENHVNKLERERREAQELLIEKEKRRLKRLQEEGERLKEIQRELEENPTSLG
mmetsp:Transcript_18336/g.19103  ORF Transcript_18336/g.19103 Transcript_18336/m.19103 type:complete len:311 (+) Transcript_18336:33-965(+)